MREPLELLQSALDRALALADQQLGNVQLIDWNAGYMKIVAQQGFAQDFLDSFRRVTTRDGCACGRALLLRDTVLIHDVTTDRDFLPYRDVARRAGFRAVQSTPLLSPSGALFGLFPHTETASQIEIGSKRSSHSPSKRPTNWRDGPYLPVPMRRTYLGRLRPPQRAYRPYKAQPPCHRLIAGTKIGVDFGITREV